MSRVIDRFGKMIPILAGLLMLFMALFVPFFAAPAISSGNGSMKIDGIVFAAAWWGFGLVGSLNIQIFSFDSNSIIIGFFLSLPNIVFSVQIARFLMGKTPYQDTLVFGILGLLFPLVITLSSLLMVLRSGYLAYAGPLPFQIIMGMILMKYLGPPAEIQEESEEYYEELWNE